MAGVFKIDLGSGYIEVEPYNYEDINITNEFYSEYGAWMFLPKIDIVIFTGNTAIDIIERLTSFKCDDNYIKVECNNKTLYTGIFNYYTSEINNDNCTVIIKPELYMPNFKNLLNIIDNEVNIGSYITDQQVDVHYMTNIYPHAKCLNTAIGVFMAMANSSWKSLWLQQKWPPLHFPLGSFYEYMSDIKIDNSAIGSNAIYNPFNYLYFTHSSRTSVPLNFSLGKLLKSFSENHMQLRWDYDEDTATLTIEHIAYYIHGKRIVNYGTNDNRYDLTLQVGLDATVIDGGKWLEETNKYILEQDNRYTYEQWTTNYNSIAVYPFRWDWQFWYTCNPAMVKNIKYETSLFETNPTGVDENGADCILLLACFKTGFSQQLTVINYGVQYTPNSIAWIDNAMFSGYVQQAMFEWDRPYITAKRKMNQPAYQMKTSNKIKRQSITMPVCCADIDAFDLVKTNMGEAWIDKYIYKVATGMVTLNLKYEDI